MPVVSQVCLMPNEHRKPSHGDNCNDNHETKAVKPCLPTSLEMDTKGNVKPSVVKQLRVEEGS